MPSRFAQGIRACFMIAFLAAPAAPALANQSDAPVDVRIWTETEYGEPVYDICYTLVEFSNLGCDENRDGNVLFEDITPGRYYVAASTPNGSDYHVDSFTVVLDGYNTDPVVVAFPNVSDSPQPVGSTDLLLLTRDPETGKSLTDVCYELVGYSQTGCDDNKDGRVKFADIPYSSVYTVRQMKTPAGYPAMDDYAVSVMPTDVHGPFTILLSQSKTQTTPDNLNVSVVFYDEATGLLVTDSENCAQLWNGADPVSKTGCDSDIVDGQVDFMDVAYQPGEAGYSITVQPACGYVAATGQEPHMLWVGQSTAILYVGLEPTVANCQ